MVGEDETLRRRGRPRGRPAAAAQTRRRSARVVASSSIKNVKNCNSRTRSSSRLQVGSLIKPPDPHVPNPRVESPPRTSAKRASNTQQPWQLTPSRLHSKSKSKSSIASFIDERQPKPSISEMIVTNVTLVQPHLHGSNQWYKASYDITIANCVGGTDLRFKVWTGKKAWLSDEPAMIMRQKRMGFTEWNGQTHNILCCSMVSLGQDAVQQNVYTFNQQSCERISGPNVSRQIQEDRRNRTEMALSLNIGNWVLFNSKMEDEPIWLGRVMSNPVWEGMCISQNNTRTKKTFDNGVEIGANEVAILVQWYEKIDLNASVLKYRVSKTINIPQVQNNFYLVYAGFEMSEMNGRTNIVPKLRSAARMKENWHNKESKFVWEMDVNVRLEALSKCGVDK